ncbi:MAG: ATP-binding cassette domain-containing protein [Rhodobacteraceae bacterium]|nr:ATP-binding cassette domain-containing protein [Paracoccaceae bacterium]
MEQTPPPVTLAVEQINAYYGESHILRNVSFTVEPGEVVCLMGRNGMGKTTTLKTLTGLLPARSGTIRFAGREITHERTDLRARQGLAYVPQGREIIPHLTCTKTCCSATGTAPPSVGMSRSRRPLRRSISSFRNSRRFCIAPAGCSVAGSSSSWRSGGRSCRAPSCSCWMSRRRGFSPRLSIRSRMSLLGLNSRAALPFCWWNRASTLPPGWRKNTS